MCHATIHNVKRRVPFLVALTAFVIIWSCAGSGFVWGANILIIHPLYSGSHVLTLRSVAESLTARGHHVHVVRWKDLHTFPAIRNANITESLLAMSNEEGRWKFLTQEKHAAFKMPYQILWNSGLSYKSIIEAGSEAFPLMEAHCNSLLSNKDLIRQLKGMKFNVAIIDIVYNECSLVLLHHLKIPAVGYWAFPFSSGEADYTTAFLPPSHVPDYALDYPRLLPPNFINVGGMQIKSPKPLPEDIEQWMQSSGEHGVVLFTMGFIFNPKVVPTRLVNAFMEAFGRLPQKFLVKFEGPINNAPPNVKVLEWIPQQDVLAHNKTRLFLTHCGLHGVMEGIYYGVPMVGMPIFIDQGDALIKMEELGIALGLDKETATADEIHHQLQRVLYEPQFEKNVRKLSLLMRDVREPPLERAIDLIHYLIRHKGAPHLKLASRNLNFVQYFSLDAILFLILLLLSLCYVQLIILRRFVPLIFAKCKTLIGSTSLGSYLGIPEPCSDDGNRKFATNIVHEKGTEECNNNFNNSVAHNNGLLVMPPPRQLSEINSRNGRACYNLRHHSSSTVISNTADKVGKFSQVVNQSTVLPHHQKKRD